MLPFQSISLMRAMVACSIPEKQIVREVDQRAMSLETRPLAALYSPPHIFFLANAIEKGAIAVGMKIPPLRTTDPYCTFLYVEGVGGGKTLLGV